MSQPRRYMLAEITARPRVQVIGMRCPQVADGPALAKLMLAAYRGTVDDEGETEDDALAEIRKTIAGDYGEFLPHCSRMVTAGAEALSATLVTRWQGRPFIAYSMTAPGARRKGLARACLIDAMQDLLALGERELRLVVTLANLPARTLYESLGFVVQE